MPPSRGQRGGSHKGHRRPTDGRTDCLTDITQKVHRKVDWTELSGALRTPPKRPLTTVGRVPRVAVSWPSVTRALWANAEGAYSHAWGTRG